MNLNRRHAGAGGRLVLAGMAIAMLSISAACSSDTQKIQHRTTAMVQHIEKRDARGLIDDLDPSVRKRCDEARLRRELNTLPAGSRLNVERTEVRQIAGNRATADVTLRAQIRGKTETNTTLFHYTKSGSGWYVDTSDANFNSC